MVVSIRAPRLVKYLVGYYFSLSLVSFAAGLLLLGQSTVVGIMVICLGCAVLILTYYFWRGVKAAWTASLLTSAWGLVSGLLHVENWAYLCSVIVNTLLLYCLVVSHEVTKHFKVKIDEKYRVIIRGMLGAVLALSLTISILNVMRKTASLVAVVAAVAGTVAVWLAKTWRRAR